MFLLIGNMLSHLASYQLIKIVLIFSCFKGYQEEWLEWFLFNVGKNVALGAKDIYSGQGSKGNKRSKLNLGSWRTWMVKSLAKHLTEIMHCQTQSSCRSLPVWKRCIWMKLPLQEVLSPWILSQYLINQFQALQLKEKLQLNNHRPVNQITIIIKEIKMH